MQKRLFLYNSLLNLLRVVRYNVIRMILQYIFFVDNFSTNFDNEFLEKGSSMILPMFEAHV